MLEVVKDIIEKTVDMWSEFFYWIGEYHLYIPSELATYAGWPRRIVNGEAHFAQFGSMCYMVAVSVIILSWILLKCLFSNVKPLKVIGQAFCFYWIATFPLLLFMAIWAVGAYFKAMLMTVLLCYALVFLYVYAQKKYGNKQ